MSLFRRLSRALLLALCPLLGAAQELPREAEKLYLLLCANCHGERLEGGLAPPLAADAWKHGDGGDEHLARIITEGVPGTEMIAFGAALDPARVRALAVYVRERSVRAQEDRTRYAKPLPNQTVQSEVARFRVETVVEGLKIPWAIAFLPDSRDLLVAERDGRVLLVRDGKLQPRPISGTPRVWAQGQGGLFVVQAHPDYAKPGNGWIYLAFSDPGRRDDEAMTAIVRGRIRDGRWIDEQEIYRAPASLYRRSSVHFGTRLVFADGYLFFGIGDRGSQKDAQDLSRPNGNIHRIHDDGRVPADNPFAKTPEALPTLWSYGHRNPQGIVARPGTGGATIELWETEHGPRGGDELNLVRRGANHGWPLITHGMNYSGTPVSALTAREGLEQPVVHWTPSIAVCGLEIYTGDKFPAWKGDLLVGSLRQEELRRVVLDGERVKSQEILFRGIGRIRTVQQGPDGLVYIGLEQPGRIVRLAPAE
jgi:glucose/arabinose dehydrogenase